MIQLKDDIKTLGTFKATINLHAEVQVEIKIQVYQQKQFNNYTLLSPLYFLYI